ncbi:MAG: Glucose-6-phosphate isomerase [Planctomycetes bacterium]|nr:Glucose-6-phosphate isomerase [Planctomycetota bacterium]
MTAAVLAGLARRGAVRRMWGLDGTLFASGAASRAEAANRLGWLFAHRTMRPRIPEIAAFAEEVRAEGVTDVVLLGMGGSSLCAEVYAEVVGSADPRTPRLHVLDSTDPEAVAAVTEQVDLARTVFLMASKSGGTIETDVLERHFRGAVEQAGIPQPGHRFVAITDPGSPLVRRAEELSFRAIFENPADIGGRYSALSLFGLVPAALLGANLEGILASAAREAAANGAEIPPESAPGARLGALWAAAAQSGCDKLVIRASPRLSTFGAWAEQLIAESTGKDGRGVLPVVDEPGGSFAGCDRVWVDVLLRGDGPAASRIGPAPHDTVYVESPEGLGGLFMRFEIATAMCCVALGVNPFDQPDVAAAKAATDLVLKERASGIARPAAAPVSVPPGGFTVSAPGTPALAIAPSDALASFLVSAAPGDYVAILAYVARTPGRHAALQQIRADASRRSRCAATLGYGPRYLHSTGQLHKGGAPNGLFVVVTCDGDPARDAVVPGRPFTLGALFTAQAEGDLRTLTARGRRVLHVRLAQPASKSLAALRDALRGR